MGEGGGEGGRRWRGGSRSGRWVVGGGVGGRGGTVVLFGGKVELIGGRKGSGGVRIWFNGGDGIWGGGEDVLGGGWDGAWEMEISSGENVFNVCCPAGWDGVGFFVLFFNCLLFECGGRGGGYVRLCFF